MEINRAVAAKVLKVVDAGLVSGLGRPVPGQMCVEAAVCYALGLPHSDDPKCVSPALRSLKIQLNDSTWSSNAARAKGMRRLAIIQLGTLGEIDEKVFATKVAEMTIRQIVPIALRVASGMKANAAHKDKLEAAALRCETEGSADAADAAARAADAADAAADAADAAARAADAARAAAYAAYAAAYAAYAAYAAAYAAYAAYAARAAAYAAARAAARAAADNILGRFAENVVQILVGMGVQSAAWLDLAPLED